MAMSEVVYWYRFYETHWGDEPEAKLRCAKCPVLRETEHTVVINYFGNEKRVLKQARKRFAYPTIELALESYRERKRHHIARLTHRLGRASEGKRQAEAMQLGELPLPTPRDGGEFRLRRFLPGSPELGSV